MIFKQIPEDFKVEEIINLETSESGDNTYFWLTKKNWTTVRAIGEIAKKCCVSFRRFKFAGTKDSNAVTKQAVSAFKVAPEILRNVKLKDIQIEIIGFGNEPISLGTLQGNRFEIIIRDLKKKDLKKIEKNHVRIKKNGFPNYFGEQRFGSGNTALIGKEIMKGNLETAVKYLLTYSKDKNKIAKKARNFAKKNWGSWNKILVVFPKFLSLEKAVLNHLVQNPNDFAGALRKVPKPIRKMYVHGYQSYLFNRALEKTITLKKLKKIYPVAGYKTKLKNDAYSKEIKKLLFTDNLTLDSFKCARMPELAAEGVERNSFVTPKKFKIGKFEKDDLDTNKYKVKTNFELPKGTYATVLLGSVATNGK